LYVRILKLSELTDDDVEPTSDEIAFTEAAKRFTARWGFGPRWNDDGRVELSIRSPVSKKVYPPTGDASWVLELPEYHTDSDVLALKRYYDNLSRQVRE